MCCAWPNVDHSRDAHKDCMKVLLPPTHPPLSSFIHAFSCLPTPFNRCKMLTCRGTSTFALRRKNYLKPSKMPIRQGTRFVHDTHLPQTYNNLFHVVQVLMLQCPPPPPNTHASREHHRRMKRLRWHRRHLRVVHTTQHPRRE